MKLHPRLSRAAVELVLRFETFHALAQPAAGGGWTIGYGHVRSARQGARVSREDAEALLLYDLASAAEVVEASLFAPLDQRPFEALTAFCFNIGADNFRSSSALARINAGAELEAADEIERWRRAELGAGPQVVDALVRRRAAEKAHFLGLPEGFAKSPRAVLRPLPGADGQGWEPPELASATLCAANSVQARLRALIPELDPPPFAEAGDPPSDPGIAPIPELEPEPASEQASVLEDAAQPALTELETPDPALPLSPPAPTSLPTKPAPTAAEPAPYVAPPPPPPTREVHVRAANDTASARPAAAASAAAPLPRRAERRGIVLPKLTAHRVYVLLAVFGACLFVVAAVLILTGRPTLANLVLGVCSVGLMTPGVYGLLGPRRPGG